MDTDKIIHTYLRMQNFKESEQAFRAEFNRLTKQDIGLPLPICEASMASLFRAVYDHQSEEVHFSSYRALLSCIEGCLDTCRADLQSILHPVFNFMSEQLSPDSRSLFHQEFSSKFLLYPQQDATEVKISKYAQDFLIHFLEKNNLSYLLYIINTFLKLEVDNSPKSTIPLLMRDELVEEHALDLKCNTTYTHREELPNIVCHSLIFAELTVLCIWIEGPLVVCGLDNSVIKAFDLGISDKWELVGHSAGVYSVKTSLKNQSLVSASEDCTVRLWSLVTRSCLVVYRFHLRTVWTVDLFTNLFVSGSQDHLVCLWNTQSISPIRVLSGHLSDVWEVKFHPSGKYVASSSSDLTIRFWDLQNSLCLRVFGGFLDTPNVLEFSSDGVVMYSADYSGTVKAWDIENASQIWMLVFEGTVESLAAAADTIVIGFQEHKLVLVQNAEAVKEVHTKNLIVLCAKFDNQGLVRIGCVNYEN